MEIELLEALALGDRAAALQKLVPGSEDHDWWSCVHAQQRGDLAAVDAILGRWKTRHGDTARRQLMERRQQVLRATADPAGHGRRLADAVGVRLDHAPEVENAAETWPSALDPALIDADRLLDEAISRRTQVELAGLPRLLLKKLSAADRRQVLTRLTRPGWPGLVEAVVADLQEKNSSGFGSVPIHTRLLDSELEALTAAIPALRTHKDWVLARIARLRPTFVDLDLDEAARTAFLDAVAARIRDLPPVFGSLKVHVAYHRLVCDLRAGVLDRARLTAYLALPRRAGYVRRGWLDTLDNAHVADLGGDFSAATGLPTVSNDEPVVRALLMQFLRDDDGESLHDYVDRTWLDRLLAEARLLGGSTDDRWTSLLGPTAVAALRDRVDIELLPTNPRRFARGAATLKVALKNAWPLRIRVFRINVAAHLASTGADVGIGVDLDGLTAGFEEVRTDGPAPMLRREESITVPTERPGTYVVEFIGNGRASRALIRTGELRLSTSMTADGLAVQVYDERGEPVPEPVVVMGGREYRRKGPADLVGSSVPAAQSTVLLPFGTQGGSTPVLLRDGDLEVPAHVGLPREQYAFRAAVVLDRQAILPGTDATALIRLDLSVGGAKVPLDRIEAPWVDVITTDRLGVPVHTRIDIAPAAVVPVTFPVPEQLVSLAISVGGRIRVRSQQRHEELRHDVGAAIATQHAGSSTESLILSRSTAGYAIRLLGKNGEPRPGRAVHVNLRSRLVQSEIATTLATDPNGEVALGALADVASLSASTPSGSTLHHAIERPHLPAALTITNTQRLRLPGTSAAVIDMRNGLPAHARPNAIHRDAGLIHIDSLPTGVYALYIDDSVIDLRVVPAAGDRALLDTVTAEVSPVVPHVAQVDPDLRVRIADAGPSTRVVVLPTPFVPDPAFDAGLDVAEPSPELRPHAIPRATYVSGRDLGDEVRYVLDRRRLPRRPGSLLEKPSLLLTPFPLRTTNTATQAARGGQSFAGAPAPAPASMAAGYARAEKAAYDTLSAGSGPLLTAWDFLADALPPQIYTPVDGEIRIPRASIGDATSLRILVIDDRGSSAHTAALPPARPALRDRRLAEPLPIDIHYREDRRLAPAAASSPLTIPATTRVALAGTVEALWKALCSLSGNADLAAWSFLPRWPTLPRDERCRLLSEHGCHELFLFVRQKDRELFDEVVRPFLAAKLHPTFIDAWLLHADLDPWLVPHRFEQLNALELALLARRMPDQQSVIARRLADAVDLLTPDPSLDDRLVDTLLAGAPKGGPDDVSAPEAQAPPPPPAEPAPKAKRSRAPGAGGGGARRDLARAADLDEAEEAAPVLYRTADKTREWAEHNWWHRPPGPSVDLIPPSRLWRDLAASNSAFLPATLADAARSFHDAVAALALVDVPFAAAPTQTRSDGSARTLIPGSNAIAATSELAPVAGPPTAEILVGQSTFRADDRWEWDGNENREKPVGAELLTAVIYEGEVVVTNPTSRTQRVSVLIQLPAGSIPVSNSLPTKSTRVELSPWSTERLTYAFYFPEPGRFTQYGARVARADALLAAVPDRAFEVVRTPTIADVASWAHLSQRGTLDEVVHALQTRNLGRLDLDRILFRLRDRGAWLRITAALADRRAWHDGIFAYSLLHGDRLREWLSRQDWLPTSLPGDFPSPIARSYHHLEYWPLLNARAHPLGDRRTVLNDGLAAQWTNFLERVASGSAPTADDWLEACHYLFAMDRPDEAIQALSRASDTASTLPHQWASAYAAAIQGDLPTARLRATGHAAHPIPRWRHRFAALLSMLDEAEGKESAYEADPDSRDAAMARAAELQPALSARVEDGAVVVDHKNLKRASVRFYRMDVELLFSRQPFLGASGDRFTFVEPGACIDAGLLGDRTTIPLPDAFRRDNIVIEVVSGAQRQVLTHFANDLAVTVSADYGQVRVRRASTGEALPAAYVKAFARTRQGQVQFYKDGYTDLRGRLDYATLSTDDLDRTERFALLIVHDDAGAVVVEAAPPTR